MHETPLHHGAGLSDVSSVHNTCMLQVPDGMLVFFPSYAVMRSCIDAWQMPTVARAETIWERIVRQKQAVVEPQVSSPQDRGCWSTAASMAHVLRSLHDLAAHRCCTTGPAAQRLAVQDADGHT